MAFGNSPQDWAQETVIAVGVFWFDTPLVLTCSGFLVLMGVQAFVFGNVATAAVAHHVARRPPAAVLLTDRG